MTTQPWGQPPGGTGWGDPAPQGNGNSWGQQAPGRNDSEDFFGGGGRSAKFEQPGAFIEGVVVGEPRIRPQTDIDTGEVKTWKDGSPQLQLVISLQTDQREDDEDDGIRNVYIKGSKTDAQRQSSAWAVLEACKAAGVRGVHEGDRLALQFTNQLPPKFRGGQGAKQWRARLIPAVLAARGAPVSQDQGLPPVQAAPQSPSATSWTAGGAPQPYGQPVVTGSPSVGLTPAPVVRQQVEQDQANPMQAPTQPAADPWGHQPQAQPVTTGALWTQEVEGQQGQPAKPPF